MLLVLAVVAGGQISSSLDLLYDVRKFDQLQTAMRANSEALVRLYAAQASFKLFRSEIMRETPGTEYKRARDSLVEEGDRLEAIALGLSWTDDTSNAARTDREMLSNLASLFQQAGRSASPKLYLQELQRLTGVLDKRLKERDQSYHTMLSETAVNARQEAEMAIPTAIMLGVIGVMTALAAGLMSARGLMGALSQLATAMRNVAEGREDAKLATAGLGGEFAEIAKALEVFQRATLERNAALESLAESEEGLKRVLDAAPVPLAMTRPSEAKLIYANRHCQALFHVDRPTEGMDVRQFYANPDERDRFVESLQRHGELRDFEVLMRRADGVDRWMMVSASQIDYRGERVFVLGYSDVTERRAIMDSLKNSEERLALIVETTPVPLVMTRLGDDTVLYANRHALSLFRIPEGESVSDRPASDFWVNPGERAKLKELLYSGGYLQNMEARLRRADGSWFWAQMSAVSTNFKGESVLMVSVDDVTQRRELEDELKRAAIIDPLTGTANRRYFLDRLESERARAVRQKHSLSLLLVDADELRRVNAVHGLDTGDRVLQALADCCRNQLREIDLLGRLSGGEFALLLQDVPVAEAMATAKGLLDAIRAVAVDVADSPKSLPLKASIGVACLSDGDGNASQMVGRAEMALAKAKTAGGNCVKDNS